MTPRRNPDPEAALDPEVARKVQLAKLELEQMVDLNPQVMLLLNSDGVITRANMAVLRMVGLSEFSAVLGKGIGEFFEGLDESGFTDLLEDESGYTVKENEVRLPDGRGRTLSFTVVGLGKQSGSFVVIVEDVSEEKAQAAHDEKEHKKQAVRALLGGLMHNINQPLTVISVRARLLQSTVEAEEIDRDELKKGLENITNLSLQIAGLLAEVDDARDYVTEPYLKGVEIMDLKRSAQAGDGS